MDSDKQLLEEARAGIREHPERYVGGFRLLDEYWSQEAVDLRRRKAVDYDREVMGDEFVEAPHRHTQEVIPALTRMMMAVDHYKREGLGIEAFEQRQAEAICCLDFLMVDPEVLEAPRAQCAFQSIPFTGSEADDFGERLGGRSSIYSLLGDDLWRGLVADAHRRLKACVPSLPPLSEHATQMKQMLEDVKPGGLQASEIRAEFARLYSQDVLVGKIKRELRKELLPYGLKNRAGVGYHLP